jgi:hypothetical protein
MLLLVIIMVMVIGAWLPEGGRREAGARKNFSTDRCAD